MQHRALAVLSAIVICLTASTQAADDPRNGITPDELFPGARFDPSIPTQEQLLGVAHGSRPLRHAEAMRFLESLADASPRATLTEYSRTYEGRKLVYLAIGEEATIARLEAFRQDHETNLDPRGRSAGEDAEALQGAKAVAWMAYGIHGDELSSVDAAVAMAYWLVAGEDDRAAKLRRELVILIDPMENPDGRDRYLSLTAAFAHSEPSSDLEDLSHATVWPWGRGNHYLFDLNRDWFSMVQPESRRSAVIASWNPQVMVDAHEMGANDTYLFTPPRHPFNPHLPPSHRKWWDRFANDQARELDGRGYDYYTREWNEEFFPGYGSSWAAYRGALGILYEMSRTSGTWVKKRSGVTRTYPQAVEHQVASSIANLETLADNRSEILSEFVADRRKAIDQAGDGSLGTWILPRRRNPGRTDRLVRLLREQGIEVVRSAAPKLSGLRDLMTGETIDGNELGDSWAIPLDQPAAPMIRVLLDPHVPMNAKFLHEEREYLERARGTRLYEVTSWSLLLSYGLEAYWTEQLPGDGWATAPVDEAFGSFESASVPYGWLIEGSSDASVRALADLLQRDIQVRVADRPFTLRETAYERGALLIQTEPNPDDLHQTLKSIAEHRGVAIQAAGTAKSEAGPDLGGSHFDTLVPPRVGIFTGYPISPSAYGALWHLMDRELELRFTALNIGRFGQADLRRYNVLIFPPASGGARTYKALLGESGLKQLKTWIESGGTAIGIGSGSDFLADKDIELTRTRLRRQALDKYPPVVFGTSPEEAMAGGPFRATGLRADDPDAEETTDRRSAASDAERVSPYDVAPIIGPGARPFTEGVDLGTPVETEPIPLAEWLIPFLPPDRSKPEPEELTRGDARLRRFSPQGAFLRVDLDPELWLTWGIGEEVPALVRARDTLVAEPPVQVPARFADLARLQLGGLLWPEAAGRLAETAYATREGSGRGQVILFLNEPEFRGWTLATRRLLLNAVLYGPGLGTRWSSPW